MRTYLILAVSLILSLGCARVRVEAPKEAIKVDISMRLDIYQHVEKDIDAIENIVSGSQEKQKADNNHSFLNNFISNVYAQEGLSPQVEQAALRRKDRRSGLISWESKGFVGENKSGLVEIVRPDQDNSALGQLISAENSDRMVIYQAVANKNGTSVEDVQKIYAKRLQADAPAGAPIEVLNANGSYEWKIK
jgi:uncharacterized protein